MKNILTSVSKSLYKTTKIALLSSVSLAYASASTALADPVSVTQIEDFLNPKKPLDKEEISRNKEELKKKIILNREYIETILDRSYTLRRLYNEAFREEFDRIKTELAKVKNTLADKEEALLDKEKALGVNKERLKTATQSSIANKLMSAARKTKIISLTEQLEKANVAVVGLKQEKELLTLKITGLTESLAKSNQALAAANEEIEKKQAKQDHLKKVADGLVAKIKELQQASEQDNETHAVEIRKLNEQLTQQKQKLTLVETELSATTTKTHQLQQQIKEKDKIIQDLEQIKAENATLKAQLDEATKRAQSLQDQKHELERDLNTKGGAIENAQIALKELQAKLEESTRSSATEREKLTRQIAEKESASAALQKEKDRLAKSLEEKESQFTVVNETLAKKVKESEALSQTLQETSLKLDATIKLSERLEQELGEVKEDLQYAQEDLAAANNKIKKSKNAEAERLAAEERRRAEEAAAEEEAEKQRLAARPVRADRRAVK